MPAARFNAVRLALRWTTNPQRFPIEGLRGLDMILEDGLWAIADRTLNDIPVAAWTDFEPRTSLHQPIACRLRFYHAHAGLVLDPAWAYCDRYLKRALDQADPKRP
ncbi:MAG TPA: hypothetical protein ENJ19_08920 [Gammaproteobacteria bacterium]|nr:hypothetical protein [Gammaproteobacteria bacterium]